MSASFTNQVIAQIELWHNHKNYDNKVYVLPKHLDNNEISKLEIPTGNPLLIELENSKISNCKYLDQERAKDLLVF